MHLDAVVVLVVAVVLGAAAALVLRFRVRETFAGRDIVIVTSHYKEDLRWLAKAGLPVHICDKAGSAPAGIADAGACPRLGINRGREVSAYLSYIVANYDSLPGAVAFIHGHELAWHQKHPAGLLRAIETADIERHGYVSLNVKGHGPYDTHDLDAAGPSTASGFHFLQRHWATDFAEFLGPMPRMIFHDCCAQFVVRRDRIRRHPRRAYEGWLRLSTTTNDEYAMGLGFEFIWHFIFGEPAMCTTDEDRPCDDAHYVQTRFVGDAA